MKVGDQRVHRPPFVARRNEERSVVRERRNPIAVICQLRRRLQRSRRCRANGNDAPVRPFRLVDDTRVFAVKPRVFAMDLVL